MPSTDRSLDVLLLTHTAADHVGGSEEVVSRFSVAQIIEGGGTASSSAYERYRQIAMEREIPRMMVDTGDVLHLDRDVALHVLLPRAEDVRAKRNGAKLGSNDIAIVGKLVHGASTMLLTSDIERRGEVALATSNADLGSEALKVGHHGSRYSSWAQFLGRVRPQIAAVSVGRNNYGHPSVSTLDRLEHEASQIFRTDTMGRIHLRSFGSGFVVVKGE
jgi:competence protein ComEC